MMRPLKVAWRTAQIARTALHYRLDGFLEGTRLAFVIRLLSPFTARGDARIAALPTGARLKLALESLGPIFVKAGQVLSTRRDLLPGDVADELAKLQDQVAAFPGAEARAIIETELGQAIDVAFDNFDEKPLASASIAQVHAATLKDGREVVIKVLRPGVRRQIASDIRLLHALAALATRFGPDPHRIRPAEVVAEIERSLSDELDLQREGANASLLRRNFAGSDDLIVPEIHWSLSSERILTMDRVYGIPSDDVAALDAAGIDRSRLAAKGVELFYTQVFRDNFFHADAHAGNIWVDPTRLEEPRFIALDFGIMGSLPERDQYFVAENFTAIFNRDYRRIAELHIEAGWMPSTLRVDELESAVRTVCEPYFTRPLSEIALGEVMAKLFHVARRYQLTVQPQLILLQKTLLNIEGVGRLLDPKLDIWATAKPVLAEILAQRGEPAALLAKFKRRLPTLLSMAEDMPRLVHGFFERGVEGRQIVTMRSDELAQLVTVSTLGQRQTVAAIFGSGLALCAVVIWRLGAGLAVWAGFPVAAWVCAGMSVAAFLYAFRRS